VTQSWTPPAVDPSEPWVTLSMPRSTFNELGLDHSHHHHPHRHHRLRSITVSTALDVGKTATITATAWKDAAQTVVDPDGVITYHPLPGSEAFISVLDHGTTAGQSSATVTAVAANADGTDAAASVLLHGTDPADPTGIDGPTEDFTIHQPPVSDLVSISATVTTP
jgi:hypothetical protein